MFLGGGGGVLVSEVPLYTLRPLVVWLLSLIRIPVPSVYWPHLPPVHRTRFTCLCLRFPPSLSEQDVCFDVLPPPAAPDGEGEWHRRGRRPVCPGVTQVSAGGYSLRQIMKCSALSLCARTNRHTRVSANERVCPGASASES